MKEDASSDSILRFRATGPTIAGALFIGVIGSGLWDVIARPGVGRVASTAVSVVTLGSHRIRDLPYSSAALDASPLPALLMLFFLAMVPFFLAIMVLMRVYVRPWLHRRLTARYENATDKKAWRRRARHVTTSLLAAYLTLIGIAAFVGFSVVNQAIAIRRVYAADMDILAPFVSDSVRTTLASQFASLQTREQYLKLSSEMDQIAERVGVTLRPGSERQ